MGSQVQAPPTKLKGKVQRNPSSHAQAYSRYEQEDQGKAGGLEKWAGWSSQKVGGVRSHWARVVEVKVKVEPLGRVASKKWVELESKMGGAIESSVGKVGGVSESKVGGISEQKWAGFGVIYTKHADCRYWWIQH